MDKVQSNALGPGDVVAITAGPFKDLVGHISAITDSRIQVAFNMSDSVGLVWFHREYVSRLQEPV